MPGEHAEVDGNERVEAEQLADVEPRAAVDMMLVVASADFAAKRTKF